MYKYEMVQRHNNQQQSFAEVKKRRSFFSFTDKLGTWDVSLGTN